MCPLAELHVHIEGTLSHSLIRELARRNDLPIPPAARRDGPSSFGCLDDFLRDYYANLDVLRERRDFTDLANAYLKRASQAGVVHAEIFFDPQSHTRRGVPLSTVILGLSDALEEAPDRFGMTASLIMCFLRDRGPQEACAIYDEALAFRDRFIGVGLDSSEEGFPPSWFAGVFARAKADGLHRVAHAGEESGPEYVWEALDILDVERIDHGIRSLEDLELVARLKAEGMPLTVCPLSNVALRNSPADIAQHPLPVMLGEGLMVTVNSDDPEYFGGYIDDNFAALTRAGVIDGAQCRQLARNSIRASFMPEARKAALLSCEGIRVSR